MSRILIAGCLFAAALAQAAILPEGFEKADRKSVQPVKLEDKAVWDEYGLEEAETATYSKPGATFTLTAWRLKDPTSALGIYQWLRPAGAKPKTLGLNIKTQAVVTPEVLTIQVGNYVLKIAGYTPEDQTLAELVVSLPRLDQSSLPSLTGFLPAQDMVANSERFILGPATLDKFYQGLKPSQAAFSLGAEAQVAKYRTKDGDVSLALFNYPTPQIARDRLADFEKIAGAKAKRSGPLVGLILNPSSADAAERVLAGIHYAANITWSENPSKPKENFGDLLVNVFILVGILIALALAAGLMFGGFRVILRKMFGTKYAEEDPMITLHLGD